MNEPPSLKKRIARARRRLLGRRSDPASSVEPKVEEEKGSAGGNAKDRTVELLLKRGRSSLANLRPIHDRTSSIKKGDTLLLTMMRDEALRWPHFLHYYRELGVDHFFVIDNLSEEPIDDLIAPEPDCSLWHTDESYEGTRYGVDWMNALLPKYAEDHWVFIVDIDEYFVFPFMETRSLRSLTGHLDDLEKLSMFSLMIDMYPKGPIREATLRSGMDPLMATPYFDGSGYYSVPGGHEDIWVRGGVRLRVFNDGVIDSAPAINKVPLIRWTPGTAYFNGVHTVYPKRRNHVHERFLSPTGALLHFKFLSTFQEKVDFAVTHGNHYAGSAEYKRYQQQLNKDAELDLFSEISARYESPESLIERDLMVVGSWA